MNHNPMVPDALSLEYKRDYGCVCGETKLSDPCISFASQRKGPSG